jgi:hypothetical protein
MIKLLHIQGSLDTGITANVEGIYSLHLKFNGQIFPLLQFFAIGEQIIFDVALLNEDYIYTCIKLTDPDGVDIEIEPLQVRIGL